MSIHWRLILTFMLPVWIVVVPAVLVFALSAGLFRYEIALGHDLTQQDIQELESAAAFGVRFAELHQQGVDLLTMSMANELSSLEAFRQHARLVEALFELESELAGIAGTELLQAVNHGTADQLVAQFSDYHRAMIMATEIASVDASTAERQLARAQSHYSEFTRFNQRIAQLLTERSRLHLDETRSRTLDFLNQLLWIVPASLLLLLVLAGVLAAWMHRRVLTITEALVRLSRSNGANTRYPALARLAESEHSAFQEMAQAILKLQSSDRARRVAEDQAAHLQRFDALTGLPNWSSISQHLNEVRRDCAGKDCSGLLISLDLDEFKTVNDVSGHVAGDQLLKHCARRLRDLSINHAQWARLGGDEFALVVNQLRAEPSIQATEIVQKILSVFQQPFTVEGRDHYITASIGAILFHDDQQSVETLIQYADTALHQAKLSGKNTYYFHNDSLQAKVENRLELESALREAIDNKEFTLHYQEQVTTEGRPIGVEALIRWRRPGFGLVSPDQFIPIAETSGLIVAIGRWVLHTACTQLASWQQHPDRQHLTMAINVSARQFQDQQFIDSLKQILISTGAPAQRLKLEITESTLLHNFTESIAAMEQLRAMGVSLSLDDFGTGYSSLQYLKRLPISQLKIDRSFVRDINHDPEDRAIVQSIIALGEALQIQIIAEGVETRGQLEALRHMGCSLFQGYYFSKPVPAKQLRLEEVTE